MVKTMTESEEDVVDLDSDIPNTMIRVCRTSMPMCV